MKTNYIGDIEVEDGEGVEFSQVVEFCKNRNIDPANVVIVADSTCESVGFQLGGWVETHAYEIHEKIDE